ncbi:hypothetical protein PRIPAC_92896 [Pristionchus pacificus]|uniref:Uncharacterized protein n=1 Tax=Pristionchus pacificus TaxID=54126 RepID=A0A2A6CHG0_PRIPA|nr:hypothetical protein PRIPAC_92896 [Pristionchus pacificus]|eukprot:PDM77527.1 hypothetical protein PRIPAC_34394 [Pristionchus pacificus]
MPPPPPPLLQYTEGRGYWRPMAPVCPRHMDRRLLMAIRVVRKNIARFDRDQTDGQRAVLCVALSPSTRLPSRYKQTSEGAAATAETVKSKFNDMRNSSLFKSFERKLGIAYTSAKMTASTSIDAGVSMSGPWSLRRLQFGQYGAHPPPSILSYQGEVEKEGEREMPSSTTLIDDDDDDEVFDLEEMSEMSVEF